MTMTTTQTRSSILVWIVLVASTLGAWVLAPSSGLGSTLGLPQVVLALCLVKAWLVASFFMGLGQSGWLYRAIGYGWIAAMGVMLFGALGRAG